MNPGLVVWTRLHNYRWRPTIDNYSIAQKFALVRIQLDIASPVTWLSASDFSASLRRLHCFLTAGWISFFTYTCLHVPPASLRALIFCSTVSQASRHGVFTRMDRFLPSCASHIDNHACVPMASIILSHLALSSVTLSILSRSSGTPVKSRLHCLSYAFNFSANRCCWVTTAFEPCTFWLNPLLRHDLWSYPCAPNTAPRLLTLDLRHTLLFVAI